MKALPWGLVVYFHADTTDLYLLEVPEARPPRPRFRTIQARLKDWQSLHWQA
jgi:hypothetical protein